MTASFKTKLFSTLRILLFLTIGIILLFLAFKDVDLKSMLTDLKAANYFWIALSLVFSFLAYISRAHRWVVLLESSGYNPKLSNCTYAVIAGYFANLAIPRIGEVTRCTALNQVEKIPVNTLIGTVILERTIDLLILFVLLFSVIFLKFDLFGEFFLNIFREKAAGFNLSMTVMVLVSLFFVLFWVVIWWFRHALLRIPFILKIQAFLIGIFEGFISVVKMKQKGTFIFHTFFIWLMYYLMTYIAFFSIEATSGLGLEEGLFVLVLGGLGMSAPVQGGIGVYHLFMETGLRLFGIEPHISPETGDIVSHGLLYATIVHTSQVLLILVLGSVSVLMLSLEKKAIIRRKKI